MRHTQRSGRSFLRQFFDPSPPLLLPADLVCAFTGKEAEELALPKRAIIAVSSDDIRFLRTHLRSKLLDAWSPFRRIYGLVGTQTVVVRTLYGGPNIASLVEELSAFGVTEFCFWGYLGGIVSDLAVGDLVIASGALREEGVSHHYLDNEDDTVYSNWAREWCSYSGCSKFIPGIVLSCDAIYRETLQKLDACRRAGVLGVEMEVASFYAVCRAKGLMGAAFLVISDLFREFGWMAGFHTREFRDGARRLGTFLQEHAIV
jgi:uridine phosphorylase